MAKKQDYLVLFPEVVEACAMLSDAQFGSLMRAAFGYRFNGTGYAGGDMAVSIAFSFVRSQIDRAKENSEEMRRRAEARWDKKAQENQEQGKEGMQSNAQHTPAKKPDAPFQSSPFQSSPFQSIEDSAGCPAPEPVILLPLNSGKEFAITAAHVAEFEKLYPAVDVPAELRKMRGWLFSNPARRKTARGIMAFCTTWLSREQDKAPARTGGRGPGAGRKPKVEYCGNGMGQFELEAIHRMMREEEAPEKAEAALGAG